MANLATKAAVEGKPLTLHAPLLRMSKAEIIQAGTRLGVDFSLTVSCYQADEEGVPAGYATHAGCDAQALSRLQSQMPRVTANNCTLNIKVGYVTRTMVRTAHPTRLLWHWFVTLQPLPPAPPG